MKTELVKLKLADWSRTVGMAMIERRATVKELIEAAVDHVGDDLMRIAVAHAEQKTGLTFGKNKRAGDDRGHMEWHAKCGCAYHPEPFPHVHPCGEAHKRPDLHAAPQSGQAPQAGEQRLLTAKESTAMRRALAASVTPVAAPQSGGKDADALLREAREQCFLTDANADPAKLKFIARVDAHLGKSKTGEGGE